MVLHAPARRSALLLLLAMQSMVSTGCSGMSTGRLPNDPSSDRPVVKTGRQARVYLITGEVQEGEVTQVSESQITLGNPSNRGFQETVILAGQIDWIEFEHSTETEANIGKVVLIVGGTVFIVFLGLAIAFSTSDWDQS
jgi:hypothetical protein